MKIKNSNGFPKIELTNVQLYSEEDELFPGKTNFFLMLQYRVETEARVEMVTLPKINLPLYHDRISLINEANSVWFDHPSRLNHSTINVGFGSTEILNGGEDNCMVKREVIEEKIQDFTMEELEKLVGGKIRIVKEKLNGNS